MSEFKYVDKPGWSKRFKEQHGVYDGDVLAVSPEFLALARTEEGDSAKETASSPDAELAPESSKRSVRKHSVKV